MSEEILQALLRLFAILIRQSRVIVDEQLSFVKTYLDNVLSESDVDKYYRIFLSNLESGKDKSQILQTAPLDSVDIVRICYKINETLNPQQKVIVLLRCLELINGSDSYGLKEEILKTCADIFRVSENDYKSLKLLVANFDPSDFDQPEFKSLSMNSPGDHGNELSGIMVLRIERHDMLFIKKVGEDQVEFNGNLLRKGEIEMFPPGSLAKTATGHHWHYSSIVDLYQEHILTEKILFEARNIKYEFRNGKLGLEKTNLVAREASLIAIMGASGSGKTTLLRVLSGLSSPTWGNVYLNEVDLHKDNVYRQIGYVSQDDLLIEELTVYENLYLNARLIFGNLSRKELNTKVEQTLEQLGLIDERDLKVGSVENKVISGGQRKRLNIGLELIRNPKVMFLDEPLSGLSSKDSGNVMALLSQLKQRGHLLFIVLHQPSSDIYRQFDNLLLVDRGGYCIYYGNTIAALSYFKEKGEKINKELTHCMECGNVRPEELFDIVEEKVLNEYGKETSKRRVSPREWYLRFENYRDKKPKIPDDVPHFKASDMEKPSRFRQFTTYLKRDLLTKLANRQYMALLFFEPIFLATILSYLVKYNGESSLGDYTFFQNENIPAYFFISIVVVVFMSLTMSAEEIFRDRKMLIREQFLELSRLSYLSAKVTLLALISAIQVVIFIVLGNGILEFREGYLYNFVMLFTLAMNANILGLIISQSFKSAIAIYISIPLLIIPQLILGGAMFSYEKLNLSDSGKGYAPKLASIIPARWAYEAMMVNQFINNSYEKKLYVEDQKLSHYRYKNGAYISELYKIIDAGIGEITNDGFSQGQKSQMEILFRELGRESNRLPDLDISLSPSIPFTLSRANQLKNVLDALSDFYMRKYNEALRERDQIISDHNSDENKRTMYELKNQFHNHKTEELVRKTYSSIQCSKVDGDLIRLYEPIFIPPFELKKLGTKSVFFSPQKILFTFNINTYWHNVLTLWIANLLLAFFLYFNGFRLIGKVLNKLF